MSGRFHNSNRAPATMNDEGLADARAANPFASPRNWFVGLTTQGMALREHIDRALRVGAARLDGDGTRLFGGHCSWSCRSV